MMKKLLPFVALTIVGTMMGCGSESPTTPTQPPPPPPTPTTRVLAQTSFSEIPPVSDAGQALLVTFASPELGTLNITVDWTFESNDIQLSLFEGTLTEVRAACSEIMFCPQWVANAFTMNKPEKLTVPDAAAGPYVLQVANFGTTMESVSVEILLTTTASATSLQTTETTERSDAVVRGALGVF